MPELPEVESLRRSLEPLIVNQRIVKIEITKPKLVSAKGTTRQPNPLKVAEFIKELTDEKISLVRRRVKNLIFEFTSGKIMLVHLKMTGQLVYVDRNQNSISGGHPINLTAEDLPSKHSHVIFTFENGTLYFNDTRMFGYLLYYPDFAAVLSDGHFEKVGLEPLSQEFTEKYFVREFKKLAGAVKKNFLENKVVVGLGNIYSDEVCHHAGVRPTRKNQSLTKSELKKLYSAIQIILPKAISEGGSSIADYLLADGSRGNYARYHQVYNRGGKECYTCGQILEKVKIGSRTTVFCKICQK